MNAKNAEKIFVFLAMPVLAFVMWILILYAGIQYAVKLDRSKRKYLFLEYLMASVEVLNAFVLSCFAWLAVGLFGWFIVFSIQLYRAAHGL